MARNTVIILGTLAAAALLAPSASAAYYNYGVLKAYEGSRLVAEGKGIQGIDTSAGVVGGHIGARDPRPGGSPARGRIWYQYKYYTSGASTPWYNITGSYNYTSSWVDQAKYRALNYNYEKVEHYAEACQVDAGAPDDCKYTGHAMQTL